VDDRACTTWSAEREGQLAEVFHRLTNDGLMSRPDGYDEEMPIDGIKDRQSGSAAIVIKRGNGGFSAWFDELAAQAHGWSPVVAHARAIEALLAEEPWRRDHIKHR
jgi:hypothetical protein